MWVGKCGKISNAEQIEQFSVKALVYGGERKNIGFWLSRFKASELHLEHYDGNPEKIVDYILHNKITDISVKFSTTTFFDRKRRNFDALITPLQNTCINVHFCSVDIGHPKDLFDRVLKTEGYYERFLYRVCFIAPSSRVMTCDVSNSSSKHELVDVVGW